MSMLGSAALPAGMPDRHTSTPHQRLAENALMIKLVVVRSRPRIPGVHPARLHSWNSGDTLGGDCSLMKALIAGASSTIVQFLAVAFSSHT